MPLDVVPKILCQRIFVLSDPGVPRTFVPDCRYVAYACAIYNELRWTFRDALIRLKILVDISRDHIG